MLSLVFGRHLYHRTVFVPYYPSLVQCPAASVPTLLTTPSATGRARRRGVAPGARAETARAGRTRAGDHKSILPQIFVFTPEAQALAGQT